MFNWIVRESFYFVDMLNWFFEIELFDHVTMSKQKIDV